MQIKGEKESDVKGWARRYGKRKWHRPTKTREISRVVQGKEKE